MKRKNIIINISLILLSILFTIIVKYVDVSSIGPDNSSVGLSSINNFFHKLIGVNMGVYKFSEICGYIPLLMVAGYGIVGIVQLVKRKSVFKVDKEIIALGIFYVIVLCVYVFFEKVIINYRPTLIDGVLEASYPSSHTILALFVCGSSIIINNFKFKRIKAANYENIIAYVFLVLVLFSRIISGVHWFSDILGGVFISSALLYSFYNALCILKEKQS